MAGVQHADVALQLGVTRASGLSPIVSHKAEEITARMLENALVGHVSGLRLLLAPIEQRAAPMAIAAEQAESVVRQLATLAEVIALDNIFRHWPDSAETSVALARLLAAGRRPARYPQLVDPAALYRSLVRALAFRGHLREAIGTVQSGPLGQRDVAEFIKGTKPAKRPTPSVQQ